MKIKIIEKIPVFESLRPRIGEIYEVISLSDYPSTLYFISVNGFKVGVWPRECKVVEK